MVRGSLLLTGTFAVWLVTGAAAALGTGLWWLLAALPLVTLLAAPFFLLRLSGGRLWPTWVALGFVFVLMLTATEVPADWYLRTAGTPVTATVGSATCTETSNDRCLYAYTLHDPTGAELPGDFRDTLVHEPGSPVDVVVDPRGWLAPRLAADLASHVFDVVTGVAFAGYAATILAALLTARRPDPPPRRRPAL